jgi:type VI secretion system secreted protein VgrG
MITAEASDVQSQLLDRSALAELVERLKKLAEQLSILAARHANDPPDGQQMQKLVSKLGQMENAAAQIVAVCGPDGVLVASGQGLLIDADNGLDLVSGGDITSSSLGMTALRAANGLSLFSNEQGAKLTAVAGKIQIQAQSDGMELLAKHVLDIISAGDWINITAKQGVRICAGGSEFVLDAQGIKGRSSSNFEMHANEHQFLGGGAAEANVEREFPELSKLLSEESWIEIALVDCGTPLRGQRYVLTDPEGQRHEGTLDDEGCARVAPISPGQCKVEFPDIGQTVEVTA